VILDRQHHHDAVPLCRLDHGVELPGAIEALRIVSERRTAQRAAGAARDPLEAKGPARHPHADEGAALGREAIEPAIVVKRAAAVVPAEILADGPERGAVVEGQVAGIAGAAPQEAVRAGRGGADVEYLRRVVLDAHRHDHLPSTGGVKRTVHVSSPAGVRRSRPFTSWRSYVRATNAGVTTS